MDLWMLCIHEYFKIHKYLNIHKSLKIHDSMPKKNINIKSMTEYYKA